MSSEAPTKDTTEAPQAAAKDETAESSSDPNASYVGAATNAASSAATTAASTAQGVKDSVFSMFGGGAKKPEKKDDENDGGDGQDRSGSAKAAKDAKAADDKGEGDDKAVSSFLHGSYFRWRKAARRWKCHFMQRKSLHWSAKMPFDYKSNSERHWRIKLAD